MSEVRVADCLLGMGMMDAGSVDAVVTDPPYGIKFMSKAWDHGVPGVPFWEAALRLVKPGARLVAFGGSRTYHRLTCAIEDAGWEIEDSLCWLYGSGFPKHESKLKPAHEPIVMARRPGRVTELNIDDCRLGGTVQKGAGSPGFGADREDGYVLGTGREYTTTGRWPANVVLGCGCGSDTHEPSCAVRMVDEQSGERGGGTGGLIEYSQPNIRGDNYNRADGRQTTLGMSYADTGGASRFFYTAKASRGEREEGLEGMGKVKAGVTGLRSVDAGEYRRVDESKLAALGVWLQSRRVAAGLSVAAVAEHFPSASGGRTGCVWNWENGMNVPTREQWLTLGRVLGFDDGYEKADAVFYPVERELFDNRERVTARNHHPTVKPVSLMRWLVRLVTPPNGLVLDPFCGSGSTGIACALEERKFLGFEISQEYAEIARARIAHWARQPSLWEGVA